ncbi:ras GEF [Ramaria rubella]|nr:ras GEF [Ramaria rubella]
MTGALVAPTLPVSRSRSPAMLPQIQTLPPIESLGVPRQHTDESFLTSSSVASHDTFMTALTSTPSPSSPAASRLNVSSPHSLRKSISVDSFIKNRRSPDPSESGPSSSVHSRQYARDPYHSEPVSNSNAQEWGLRTKYTNTDGQFPPHSASKSLASRILGRARGHSLSGPTVPDYDDPYLDDSEHERAADMAHLPSHRPPFANGFGKGKAKARPGDVLLLPPRTPTLSNASSTSSLSSVTNGAAFSESVPPVPPMPQFHHRRPNVPGPLVMPRRVRSGSLGGRNGNRNSNDAIFSIAVVGASGCGKTTVIKKGLRMWGVSDESICTITTPQGRIRYGTRTMNAPRDEETIKIAQVLEVASDTLCLDSPDGAWPEGLPSIDGVLVCYDASDPASFARVPDLLACYHSLHLSAVAMACKCDLEKKILPHHASERVAPYNVGLVEVTSTTDVGKRKMRHCFHWLIRAIEKARRGEIPLGSPYRNPASPDVLNAPWSEGYGYPETRNESVKSRVSTPSAGSPSSTTKFREHPLATAVHMHTNSITGTSTPTPRSPSVPNSPMRVKSTNDLMSEVERNRQQEMRHDGADARAGRAASMSTGSLQDTLVNEDKDSESLERGGGGIRKSQIGKGNEPPPKPWATLEELLDKLFFLAVSGDDPTFIKHFFLTYRKFATPRSVLLGMQKRVRQLNQEHADLLLGSYAQMRICDLLEEWIENYPNDFAAPGTMGAITALVKQISSNPCTLHYGSDILPFLDEISGLQDLDASWSIQPDDSRDESDDEGFGIQDDEDDAGSRHSIARDSPALTKTSGPDTDPLERRPKLSSMTTRERKGSLPLSTKSMMSTPLITTLSGPSEVTRPFVGKPIVNVPPRNSPRELVKLAQTLATYDPSDIAQQITKMQSELFLAIEPRQWLRYTMGNARSETVGEPISASASFYNHLANWVSSLILAHEKVRPRERQVERFVVIAQGLRQMNNYVGLRAVMTGISNATFPNDEILTLFKQNNTKTFRTMQSHEILLNSSNNHRSYRLALRNTNGPGIPDMEVHTFDMVRANESNPNYKLDDPNKIHWGKFTLMGRMITMLQSLQDKIRSSGQYDYPERKWIREMLSNDVMDEETIRSRVFLPPDDAEPVLPLAQGLESPSGARTDAARFKRLFFW